MDRTSASRKRNTPGASPMMQQPTTLQPTYEDQQLPSNLYLNNFDFSTDQFPTDQSGYVDSSLSDPNAFNVGLNAAQAPTYGSALVSTAAPTPSTDLVRRNKNSQIAAQNGQQENWNGYTNTKGQRDDENEQDLEKLVAMAKRDAQGKRKQIPPFVQKLSSFLDSGNTELIRWSDDGKSFIVIDEDEFARTLIPELFKHNNYASFVRQLNMYGFHKTVNITDGSLRQSEKARKGVKPPSMYSHPYFRRNRPDLLWLIQKPANKPSAKRKRDGTLKGDFDSEDERQNSPGLEGRPVAELGRMASQDVATLPRSELASMRQELRKLQTQQNVISRMITQLKEQNDQFYRQASAFQTLHDRHENSINAILTFLATFYNRSLDGNAGQNLVNMFSNPGQQNNQQQYGSVVEDFTDGATEETNQQQMQMPRFKRPQLLLPAPSAPATTSNQNRGSVATAPASARSSLSPPVGGRQSRTPSARPDSVSNPISSSSPQFKEDAPTPNLLDAVPESDQMMSLINSVNASTASSAPGTAAPAFDFSNALSHYENANGNSPLSAQQRDEVLAIMANQQAGNGNNNALTSPPPVMPDLNQFKETQQQLEMLSNMQKAQDAKVQELNRRLQPLSPSGAIPGVGADGAEGFFDSTGAPGDFDPNAYINFDDNADLGFDFSGTGDDVGGDGIQWDFSNTADTNNLGIGGEDMFPANGTSVSEPQQQQQRFDGGGRIESLSSAGTSPGGMAGEGEAIGFTGSPTGNGTPNKRPRRS